MRIFIKRYATGTLSAAATAVLPTLTLTWRQRTRNRQKLFLDNGDDACVMLPKGTVMNNGDVLDMLAGTPGVRAQSAYAPFSPEPELNCTHALGQTEHDRDAEPHVAMQHNRSGADPANDNERGLSERVYVVAGQPSL